MAATKTVTKSSWSLEIKTGIDKDGNPKYSKKSLPGNIKANADLTKVMAIADGIALVLDYETRDVYLTDTEEYENTIV